LTEAKILVSQLSLENQLNVVFAVQGTRNSSNVAWN